MISKQYISEVKLVRVEEEWGVWGCGGYGTIGKGLARACYRDPRPHHFPGSPTEVAKMG